jgi:hypothetical protein
MTDVLAAPTADRSMPHPWEVCYDTPFGKLRIPITGTGPTVPVPVASQMTLALAAGEMHGTLFRKALARYHACGNDRNRFLKGEVSQLLAQRAISASEVPALHEIVDIATDKPGHVPQERLRGILATLVDAGASPMAVTIASIAVNAGTAQSDTGGAVAGADIGGAIVGGVAGWGILSIPGAIFGSATTSLAAAIGAV